MSGHRRKSYVGKVVDSWTYEVKDMTTEVEERDEDTGEEKRVQKVINKKVTVEVRIHKSTDQSQEPPYPTTAVEFSVTCPDCPDLGMNITGTDIEALRAAAWAKLDKKFEIQWDSYFLVKIERERVYHGLGTGLSFNYDWVYKGTTWDGKLLLRRDDYRDERVDPWPGEFKDEDGKVLACIPVTDTNKDALEEFSKRIDTLREKLADFLRPDKIMQTLADMNALKLLPPAEETSDE